MQACYPQGLKMESSPGLLNSLPPPALMVLASATESANGSASLCQQGPSFAVPVTMEKGQVPFLGSSYTLAPVFHQGDSSGVEYPPHLLHLHPQFGVLGYRPLHPYPPFQEVECFRQAYLAGSKSLKQLPSAEPPQLRYLASERDFKKYRGQPPAGSATTGKRNPTGTPGMTASSETLWKSSQQGRSKGSKLAQDFCVFLRCPLCQEELKRGDVQQHLQQELERLSALQPSCEKELLNESTSHQPASSPPVKEEVDSPRGSPLSIDGGHHLERQQTFQQVRINRESRRNARAKRCKRPRPSDEEQVVGPFPKDPRFPDAEEDGSQHAENSWQSLERSNVGLRGSSSHLAPGLTSRDSEGDVDTDGDEPPLSSKLKCPAAGRVEGQAHTLMEAQDKDSPTLRQVPL
ncbi:E3 ubiquitin-protein ligase Rnf220-like [Leucoraja erinacea]|uniref:E3 ubiquitin-protein ligase Rnf220-like n=1 Tax=Leucoraja erinaceus TaxID=7782 RepID=UPI0024554311|nr:E3 ubiquitin-protein ligase Rnf220-like [Leucoraja erinacea]